MCWAAVLCSGKDICIPDAVDEESSSLHTDCVVQRYTFPSACHHRMCTHSVLPELRLLSRFVDVQFPAATDLVAHLASLLLECPGFGTVCSCHPSPSDIGSELRGLASVPGSSTCWSCRRRPCPAHSMEPWSARLGASQKVYTVPDAAPVVPVETLLRTYIL